MPTKRMHRGLVALSASAVAAVYMVGYLRTQSADASLGATDVATTAAGAPTSQAIAAAVPATLAPIILQPTAVPQSQSQAPVVARSAPTPQPTAAPVAAARPAQAQGAYKDGTYTGQGSSRRGGVVVTVAVQGGRIATVTITQSSLQYPLRDIAALPGEVVQRQSAQVDTISRATYSSQAFKQAVSQALSKAA